MLTCLRQFINDTLAEARAPRELPPKGAFTPEQAGSLGLALFVTRNTNDITFFTLVDGSYAWKNIVDAASNVVSSSDKRSFLKKLHTIVYDSVIGASTLQMNDACGAWEVTTIATDEGWGPTLYDAMLSWAKSNGETPWLVPDRSSVLSGAEKVWVHYASELGDEVHHEPVNKKCQSDDHKKRAISKNIPDALNMRYKTFWNDGHQQVMTNANALRTRIFFTVRKMVPNFSNEQLHDFLSKTLNTNNFAFFADKYVPAKNKENSAKQKSKKTR